MLYKEWLLEWFENYIIPSVKPKTRKSYEAIIHQRLIPMLGNYQLDEVTPLIVQKYITSLLQNGNFRTGRGLATSTVNTIIVVIQSSLETAQCLGLVHEYRMKNLKRPKLVEKQIECFTAEEQKKIEQAVLNDKRDKMIGVLICLYTGLRIGELLALEWNDVDFERAELSITKTCHDGRDREGRYCRYTNPPKTETSSRVIPYPRQLSKYLKALKKRSKSRYVIADGEHPPSVRSYQRSFELLQQKIKVPQRGFHALRHSFATRACECGMDIKTLSEILGHKNPMVTLKRYAHSLMGHKHMAMNRLGKLL